MAQTSGSSAPAPTASTEARAGRCVGGAAYALLGLRRGPERLLRRVRPLRIGPGVCDAAAVAIRRHQRIIERLALRVTGADVRGPGVRGPTVMAPVAIGALAVGAVAIGRLAIGRATIKRLSIEELDVTRLKVTELEVAGEKRPPV